MGASSRAIVRRLAPTRLRRALWAAWNGVTRAQQLVFERRLGVSTSGHVYLDDLGVGAAGLVFYEACQWLPVRRTLKALDPGPSDVFVDLGSGKGQAVLIAGLLPYGRVLGVELAEELTREAERNIRSARAKLRAGSVEAITADALEWEIPADLSVLYAYCPFTDELFHAVMTRVFASFDDRPRTLRIVYTYAWEHNWLLRTGRVVVEDVHPAQWPPKPWWWRSGWVTVTYRVVPAGEGGPGVPRVRRRFLRPRRALERWSAPNDHAFKLVRGDEVLRRSSDAAA